MNTHKDGTDLLMRKTIDWHERAAAMTFETRALLGADRIDAVSGKTFPTVSPLSGQHLADIADCDEVDVDRAVARARAAFESRSWSGAHPRLRKQVLHTFADLLLVHKDELALLITLDMGKPISDARREVESSVRELRFFAESVDKVYGDVVPTNDDSFGMMSREPVGVVGAITPWNFPVMMPIYKLGPALATGNSVVFKPAEQASLAALRLASLALEAGLPEGVLGVIPGGPAAGQALALHMDVDVLTFTGSTSVGKKLLTYSGQSNMKAVWLECGGKSPNIVLADAPDLEKAAEFAASAIFHGTGQVCNAGSRLLLDAAIHDEFIEMLIDKSAKFRPMDALDDSSHMGPIVDSEQLDKVVDYIDQGSAEGAQVASGGKRALEESGGYYLEPTIFVDVQPSMSIAREEIFGPVLSTIRINPGDDVVEVANDSMYGLAAAVWTSDLTRAHRLARELKAGTVYVNTYDRGDNSLPFGGYKQSGVGADRSLHALDKYTNMKTTWMDLS